MIADFKPTVKRNGTLVGPNPRAGLSRPGAPQVGPLKQYGNAEQLLWLMDYEIKRAKRDAKLGLGGRHQRTLLAIQERFDVGPGRAEAIVAGLRAYRRDVFATKAPELAATMVDRFEEVAADALRDRDHRARAMALREIARIVGAYAPVQVEVAVKAGPSMADQLEAAYAILSPEARRGLELALTEIEQAQRDGRLQLKSGDDDAAGGGEPSAASGSAPAADVEDAVIVAETKAP